MGNQRDVLRRVEVSRFCFLYLALHFVLSRLYDESESERQQEGRAPHPARRFVRLALLDPLFPASILTPAPLPLPLLRVNRHALLLLSSSRPNDPLLALLILPLFFFCIFVLGGPKHISISSSSRKETSSKKSRARSVGGEEASALRSREGEGNGEGKEKRTAQLNLRRLAVEK